MTSTIHSAAPANLSVQSIPASSPPKRRSPWISWLLQSAALSLVLLAASLIAIYAYFGSISTAVAYAKGERLILSPAAFRLEEGSAGEKRELRLTICNFTGKDVQLVGHNSTCGSSIAEEFPIQISRGQSRQLSLSVVLGPKDCALRHLATLFTDYSKRGMIPLMIARDSTTSEGCPLK